MNYEYEVNRMIDTCLLNDSTGVRKLSVMTVIVNPGDIYYSFETSKCSLIL